MLPNVVFPAPCTPRRPYINGNWQLGFVEWNW